MSRFVADHIELYDEYITNQPLIGAGRWKRTKIPDPSIPPTEAYLFCAKVSSSGRRRRFIETITGATKAEMVCAIATFAERSDVVFIPGKESQGGKRKRHALSFGREVEASKGNDEGLS